MALLCATRHLKNARHLQATAPHILPREEPPDGYASRVPFDLLGRLHAARQDELGRYRDLAEALRRSPVPPPRAKVTVRCSIGLSFSLKYPSERGAGPSRSPSPTCRPPSPTPRSSSLPFRVTRRNTDRTNPSYLHRPSRSARMCPPVATTTRPSVVGSMQSPLRRSCRGMSA